MKLGTKSLLWGAHAFWMHPVFVWRAWCKLFGFTLDPRILVACVVHDWGYWRAPNIDGPEGQEHPRLGAEIMHKMFDLKRVNSQQWERGYRTTHWYDFALLHSRHFAKKYNRGFSKLCVADKLAFCITPWWLYLPMVRLSGEINEYRATSCSFAIKNRVNILDLATVVVGSDREWFEWLKERSQRWVDDNKDKYEESAA